MKVRFILAATAAVVTLGLGSPVMAQDQTNENNQINDGTDNTQNEDSLQNVGNDTLNGWNNFNNDNAADTASLAVSTTVTKTFSPSWTDSSEDNDGNGSFNGNSYTTIVAEQTLQATNTNSYLDELVDLDGEDETDTAVGYNSGSNSVSDNAFAAYAGILNAAWNTGINANAQAATNIAAQGSVTFGDAGGGGGGGGDGGAD